MPLFCASIHGLVLVAPFLSSQKNPSFKSLAWPRLRRTDSANLVVKLNPDPGLDFTHHI